MRKTAVMNAFESSSLLQLDLISVQPSFSHAALSILWHVNSLTS